MPASQKRFLIHTSRAMAEKPLYGNGERLAAAAPPGQAWVIPSAKHRSPEVEFSHNVREVDFI